MKFKFAVGTVDGEVFTDDHFGESSYFFIYEYNDGNIELVEKRENTKYEERMHGDPQKAGKISNILNDIDVLIGKEYGPNVVRMKKRYVCIVSRIDSIEDAVNKLNSIVDDIKINLNREDKDILFIK